MEKEVFRGAWIKSVGGRTFVLAIFIAACIVAMMFSGEISGDMALAALTGIFGAYTGGNAYKKGSHDKLMAEEAKQHSPLTNPNEPPVYLDQDSNMLPGEPFDMFDPQAPANEVDLQSIVAPMVQQALRAHFSQKAGKPHHEMPTMGMKPDQEDDFVTTSSDAGM